jgi:hypothetical protein
VTAPASRLKSSRRSRRWITSRAADGIRRKLRIGAQPAVNGTPPSVDLDALLAALTPEQRAHLAAKINAPTGPVKKTAGTRSDSGDWK